MRQTKIEVDAVTGVIRTSTFTGLKEHEKAAIQSQSLKAKDSLRAPHPVPDRHGEGAVVFTTSALHTVACMMVQRLIMSLDGIRDRCMKLRQIQIFINLRNIQMCGTGKTVIAVHTLALERVDWCAAEKHRIIALGIGRRFIGNGSGDFIGRF